MTLLNYYKASYWRNTFKLLLLGNILSCMLISARVLWYQENMFLFLIWNLFLAGLPLIFSFCLKFLFDSHKGNLFTYIILSALWLLFLPNAPYIITDLMHLSHKRVSPVWYDSSVIFSAALTGLMMGLISLYIVHQILNHLLKPITSWIIVATLTGLSSFGVYLGRFLRWNSWDLFTRPMLLFDSIYESMFKFSAISFTLVFSCLFIFAYTMIYNLLSSKS